MNPVSQTGCDGDYIKLCYLHTIQDTKNKCMPYDQTAFYKVLWEELAAILAVIGGGFGSEIGEQNAALHTSLSTDKVTIALRRDLRLCSQKCPVGFEIL